MVILISDIKMALLDIKYDQQSLKKAGARGGQRCPGIFLAGCCAGFHSVFISL